MKKIYLISVGIFFSVIGFSQNLKPIEKEVELKTNSSFVNTEFAKDKPETAKPKLNKLLTVSDNTDFSSDFLNNRKAFLIDYKSSSTRKRSTEDIDRELAIIENKLNSNK